LIWVYYSAQILFLGAEFTQVYANRYGSKIKPDEGMVLIDQQESVQKKAPQNEAVPEPR
jgi:membrane protein